MRSMKLNVDNQEIYTFPSYNALLKTEISLPVPVRGRRVGLSKNSEGGYDMFLILCEVQVWGKYKGYTTNNQMLTTFPNSIINKSK